MNSIPQTKPVCQLDADGIYVCQTVADADPLQPENWLIPAGCIDTEPPEVKPEQAAQWQPEKRRGNTSPIIAAKPPTAPTMGSLKRWKP